MKVTVAILAKNEAEMLPGALESVQWADGVVVGVDETTTDDTAEMARKLGAKVLTASLKDGFAAAKNAVIAACKTNWVLVLDADERVDEQLARAIQVLEPADGVGAYRLVRHNFSMGVELRHGGWERDTQVRLVRREGAQYSGAVHEEMQVAGETVDLHSGALIHHSHRSVASLIAKINQYTDFEVEKFHGPTPDGLRGLVAPAVKEFWRRYWRLGGYKDGTVGLIEAGCSAFYMFAAKAKIWESRHKR